MGLEKADRQHKGLWQGTQRLNGGWCDNAGLKALYVGNKIVANSAAILRNMFLADQGLIVAGLT